MTVTAEPHLPYASLSTNAGHRGVKSKSHELRRAKPLWYHRLEFMPKFSPQKIKVNLQLALPKKHTLW